MASRRNPPHTLPEVGSLARIACRRHVRAAHQNFPDQLRHVLTAPTGRTNLQVIGLAREGAPGLSGLQWLRNKPHQVAAKVAHRYPRHFGHTPLHGQVVCRGFMPDNDQGFVPDGLKANTDRSETVLGKVTIDTGSETEQVHFLGKLPYAQYRRVLQFSAVHVYLTYPFVLSWSLLEALARGCAVVASDTAPVREVIRQGENGWLVDFFDGSQIVDAVLKVLADPSGLQDMRRAAVESVKERFAQA